MAVKTKPVMRADTMLELGIKYISGKWFNKRGEEIKDIEKYMYHLPQLSIETLKDITEARDLFIIAYGDKGSWWPQMEIVKKAIKTPFEPPLAFPLNVQQLMIINRLIYGRDECMFILTGIGGSGKSTFANIIRQIFGGDVASLNLCDLSNDFMLATGCNKRLIYSDELNTGDIRNNIIKTLVSKQYVTINPKNQTPFTVRWQGSLLFSCNKPPKLDISDSGLLRRIVYYSMNTKIQNPDVSMKDKVFTEEELVNIVSCALGLEADNWFDIYFKNDTRKVLMDSSNVYKCWSHDYDDYKLLCFRGNYRALSQANWEEIHDLFQSWLDEMREEKAEKENESK